MNTLYVDISCGVSGDMLLAALVDCGVPLTHLREELMRLPIDPFTVDAERQMRSGIACLQMRFGLPQQHSHRRLDDLLELLDRSGLGAGIQERSARVLRRLGQAEAEVHNIPLANVHFHEIGALDTIIDIVGFCICCDYLQVDEVLFSTLLDGHGTITTEHGVMPVPVPATARLTRGFMVETCEIPTELITPTGAAVLTTLGKQETRMPALTISKEGYGCGTRVFKEKPNLLRIFLGQRPSQELHDAVWVLESDLDHISGEIMGYAAQLLLDQGALDASYLPLFMKKGRPGYRLSVLCREEQKGALIDTIMLATRTLGVRQHLVNRTLAQRQAAHGVLAGIAIQEKKCSYKGHSFTKPEYDSLVSVARATGRSLLDLMEEFITKHAGRQA
ncbi:MAG: nickel pincer cofactor biosynthesis protein LarC [Chitinivibrionales bacterium]|nr:nickel pincer cofactor biosynthesis protein LarC [Chitinivibrionales bacterium]